MIAITFALPTESSDLRRLLRDARDDGDFISGSIHDRAVAILHTGIGAKNCSARMEALLHKARPRVVISSGFAGAVAEELQVGDLVLAENFSDQDLLTRAEPVLRDLKPRVAKLFTAASIVDSTAERNQIARESGAAAVDMETGAIFGICKAHGVQLLSLRAISDTPKRPFPAPPDVLFDIERQQPSYGRLFAYLLRHPASISRLLGFGREINRVRAKLTGAIVALVRELDW
jgi:adenosylhomocysteine nucleosidase